MSIKLSLKELKDLLKIQNKKLKKRRKNKKKVKPGYENNIRSSSAHMISGGTTMMNTANEQGELIRLQRQALEDKLKEDKANNIKKEAKEKEAKEQYDKDIASGVVPYNRLAGNGGSNKLRDDDLRREVYEISNTLNQYMFDPRMGELVMPAHSPKIPTQQTNAYIDGGESKEEPVNDVPPVVTTQPSTPATPAKKPSSRNKKKLKLRKKKLRIKYQK